MGEVFRAQDTRLGRSVAIKISAESFSERFEREARMIAALNHPNICTLYDVGPDYLVMDMVEGLPSPAALRKARFHSTSHWRSHARWPTPFTPLTGEASCTAI
jgi:serine/threonine protein kinase